MPGPTATAEQHYLLEWLLHRPMAAPLGGLARPAPRMACLEERSGNRVSRSGALNPCLTIRLMLFELNLPAWVPPVRRYSMHKGVDPNIY